MSARRAASATLTAAVAVPPVRGSSPLETCRTLSLPPIHYRPFICLPLWHLLKERANSSGFRGIADTMTLSVVILTYNSEASIGATLDSAARVSDDIHVVDSGSTDGTLAIVAQSGAHLTRHPFESYGAQRNWAIDTLALRHGWELHLDADERLSEPLIAAIEALAARGFADAVEGGPAVGYFIPRLGHFLGHPIRHRRMYPNLP